MSKFVPKQTIQNFAIFFTHKRLPSPAKSFVTVGRNCPYLSISSSPLWHPFDLTMNLRFNWAHQTEAIKFKRDEINRWIVELQQTSGCDLSLTGLLIEWKLFIVPIKEGINLKSFSRKIPNDVISE